MSIYELDNQEQNHKSLTEIYILTTVFIFQYLIINHSLPVPIKYTNILVHTI